MSLFWMLGFKLHSPYQRFLCESHIVFIAKVFVTRRKLGTIFLITKQQRKLMNNVLLPEESTMINIDGVAIWFNVLKGQLIAITKDNFSDLVKSFITRWGIKENTENVFSVSKVLLLITTPDNKQHECIFVIESMKEADTLLETVICETQGIDALQDDYMNDFDADIGRNEIETLITEAIMSDSTCETWPDYNCSFVIFESEHT